MTKFFAKTALTALIASVGLSACNEDPEDYSIDGIDLSINNGSNTAITAFNLKANRKIIAGLDSVFFTIDLENFSIYNADSLPKGTNVGKMLVNIGNSGSSKIVIKYTDYDTKEAKEIDYSESGTKDSINFFDDVTITVTSLDERFAKTYDVKVNVHQVEADSLCWGSMQYCSLPTNATAVAQGTALLGNTLCCFTADADGNVTLARTATPHLPDSWSKESVTLPFVPRLESVKAGTNRLYMLSNDGSLYTSVNATDWTNTDNINNGVGYKWVSTLGTVGDTLYGIATDNETYVYACIPAGNSPINGTPVPDDFPVTGTSQMYLFYNQWSTMPQAIITGGRCADGSLSSYTWGFDGKSWVKFGCMPENAALENMTMFPYYTFTTNTTNWKTTKYTTLFAFGGSSSDGTVNKTVYTSRDFGVNWYKADQNLQLPEEFPALTTAQAFVIDQTLYVDQPNLSGSWNEIAVRRIPAWSQIELPATMSRAIKPITQWECPYIYIFGGVQPNGQLNQNIWRGAINRLTFKPLQ